MSKSTVRNSKIPNILREPATVLAGGLILSCLLGAQMALAAHNVRITVDSGGPDDVPAQTDVSLLGFDDSHLSDPDPYFFAQMQFDDTVYPGGNSGDGCIFFDSDDADGFTDFAVCGSFIQNGTLDLQSAALYDCKGSEPNNDEGKRCGFIGGGGDGSNGIIAQDLDGDGIFESDGAGIPLVTPYDTTCSLITTALDPFNGVGTHNTSGEQDPITDTQLTCIIYTDELVELNGDVPTGIAVSNACSFTSPDPGSESKDCVVDAGAGFLQIVKNATGGDDTFYYTLDADGTNDCPTTMTDCFASITTVGGTGSTDFLAVDGSATLNLAEVVPDGWQLDSATCDNGDLPSALTTGAATTVVCTFNNSVSFVPLPAIKIVKTGVWNDDLPLPDGDDFLLQAGETVSYTFDVTNCGNVALDPVTVTDPLIEGQDPPGDTTITCNDTVLAADTDDNVLTCTGGSTSCTATYTITQADIDSDFTFENGDLLPNQLDNIATAEGTAPAPDSRKVQDTDDEAVEFLPGAFVATMTVVKSLADFDDNDSSGDITLGDELFYSFLVTNIGNLTLSNVDLTDDTFGLAVTCLDTTLDPTESTTCATGTTAGDGHVVTLAEANAGNVYNLGTTTGDCPDDSDASTDETDCATDNDDLNTPVQQDPSMTVVKSLNGSLDNDNSGDITLGDELFYSFLVTNTGNVTLSNVDLTDDTFGLTVTCTDSTLEPTENTTCATGTMAGDGHVVTLADANAGNVQNTGTTTGDCPDGTVNCATDNDTLDTPVVQHPAITNVKSLASYDDNDTSGDISNGDDLWYQFLVTNTGDVTLDPVSVVDNTFAIPVSCPVTVLAPGASTTCTADAAHTVTLDEADAGNVQNTATASGTPPVGDPVTAPDTLDTPVVQHPAITNVKSLASYDDNDTSGDISNGDGLWYQFLVTNTGDVTLDPVSVVDNTFAIPVSCPVTVLAPGASTTCTADAAHTVTLDEADAGNVQNTATASGTPPVGDPVTAPDTLDTPVVQHPAITNVKSLASYDDNDTSGDISNGDDLWYQFLVTNTGDVTLDPVSVVDNTFAIPVSCPVTVLAPGASTTCTADAAHTVTLDEADAGNVQNTATASGTPPVGDPVTAPDTLDTPVVQHPAITNVKSLASYDDNDTSGDISNGDGLWYQFLVTNTGDVTLDPVSVVDNTFAIPVSCPVTVLAPGASTTCTADAAHTVTLDEADAGNVQNTATASGTPPVGDPVTAPDTLDTPVVQHPAITNVKSLASYDDNDTSGDISNGDGLWYQFLVTNTGDVTLDPVSVVDNTFAIPVTCPVTVLAPGASTTCTADAAHTVTLDEANAGNVQNTATASGTPPVGDPVTAPDTLDTPVVQHPAITNVKSLASYDDNDTSGDISNGDGLWYQFLVTNTGDVTLNPVSVVDNTFGIPVSCPVTTLDPGAWTTCTADAAHTVTLDEADAGNVQNTATASGTPPVGDPVTAPDTLDTPVVQHPAITNVKSLASYDDNDTSGDISNGDGLWYQFLVTNTGDVTLDPVSVVDNTFAIPVSCPVTVLAPGASTTCTADAAHTVTLDEADAGNVQNTATASGTPPVGDPVTAPDTLDTPVVQHPAITNVKSLASYDDNDTSGDISNGDDLWYQFLVTNTGDVTLDPVSVVDNTFAIPVSCPVTVLAPGASTTCTADAAHTVTLDEADAGNVQNTATASGTPPVGDPVTAPDTLDTPVVQHPAITNVKSLASYDDNDTSGDISNGDGLWYQFLVTNTGDVTLDPVSVVDNTFAIPVSCPVTVLAPGASTTCTADAAHTVTLDEADAGNVQNTATASGTPPVGDPVTAPDTLDTPVVQHPAITNVKSLASYDDNDTSGDISNGDGLWYQFLVTNTGDVTLDPVSVVDNTFAIPVTCPVTVLAPGASTTCTADAAHTVTLDEANAGNVQNTATASGTPPVGDPVTAPDTLDTPVVQHPAITNVKSLASYDDNDTSGDISNGDGLWYQFLVTNTGDVTLNPVSVVDNTFGIPVSCPVTTLDPGAWTTCTADAAHTVTLDEADAGNVQNTATASGTPPVGDPVTAPDTLDTPVVQHPAITNVKSLASYDDNDTSGDISNGDGLWYQFLVTNTGDVTLDPVSVVDNTFAIPVSCPVTVLAPGASTTCTADAAHTVTLDEANAGNVQNTATASGTPPVGDPVTAPDTLDTPVVQHPAHTLTKDFDPDQVGDGEMGEFTLFYTNTGDVTLEDIVITDPVDRRLVVGTITPEPEEEVSCLIDDNQLITCTVDELAPGESVTITVEFTALGEALLPVIPGQTSGASYVVFFENNYVLYGSTFDGTAKLLDADRNEVDMSLWMVEGVNQDIFFNVPYAGGGDGGFLLHLSCSEPFIDGWGATGPIEGEDDEDWRVNAYTVERFNSQGFLKDCTQTFPFDVLNEAEATATPAGGTLDPNPITAEDTLNVISVAPIEVTRDRVRKGDVEIQYFNTSFEGITIEIIQVEWNDINSTLGIGDPLLEFATYQDGVDLGLSGCNETSEGTCRLSASISTLIEARKKDWLKLSFDSEAAPGGLTVTIVTDTGAIFTYVY